ncbi:hypothetical protein TNCV_3718621 [Trichonephila clavipes]|nr:hypothetical protein TNCV_3718621 [Trichonephila clavipes]
MPNHIPHTCCYELSYSLSNTSLAIQIARSLSNQACLEYDGAVDYLAWQLEHIWQEIPQETIRVLYHSMPRCMAAYIQAREKFQGVRLNECRGQTVGKQPLSVALRHKSANFLGPIWYLNLMAAPPSNS